MLDTNPYCEKQTPKNNSPSGKNKQNLPAPASGTTSKVYVTVPEDDLIDLGKKLHACIRDLTVLRKYFKRTDVTVHFSESETYDNQTVTIQSQDQTPDISGESGDTVHQVTTTFDDTKESTMLDEAVMPIIYQPTGSADAEIIKFMSRPVKIANFNWAVNTTLSQYYTPWSLYFGNPAINRKLENYAYLRCDLHIKILINASPFYYGAILASYNPLVGTLNSGRIAFSSGTFVGKSQRPHLWIYPQTNEGGEMVLPYLNTKEWITTATAGAFDDLGALEFNTATELRSANGTVGTSLDVAIFAWAENVELAGLTVAAAVQSQDEYKTSRGPVSKPASAIARATGSLSNVPVIGPYMTATSIAAEGVANIAALFGYSKVPVIDNVCAFKNLPFHGLASSDISEPTDKLTVDSKNELTINNKCIGDKHEDPLNISSICQRSSYLTKFDWLSTDSVSQLLWNCYVQPRMATASNNAHQYVLDCTPMWVAASCFTYWRGDIIFDIKVICSQYHRGRLRLSWDPIGNIAGTTNSSEMVYTQIIDITETSNFSVRIPYTQSAAYLKVPADPTAQIFSTSALGVDASDTVNGILTIRVQNEQTSPIAAAPIEVLVSVRGAENLEFAAPADIDDRLTFYTVQSQDELVSGVKEVDMGGKSSVDPHINLIYMGEKIESFRSLFMRCNHHRTDYVFASEANIKDHATIQNRRPLFSGFDPDGIHRATGASSGVAEPYNFVANTPYHLISACFLGERGSFTWKFDVVNNNIQTMNINRMQQSLNSANYPWTSANVSVSGSDGYAAHYSRRYKTPTGAMMQNSRTNTGFSVNVPMYSNLMMLDTAPATRTLGKSGISSTDALEAQFSSPTYSGSALVNTWFQIGPDYSPFFFLNVPTLFWLKASAPPAP